MKCQREAANGTAKCLPPKPSCAPKTIPTGMARLALSPPTSALARTASTSRGCLQIKYTCGYGRAGRAGSEQQFEQPGKLDCPAAFFQLSTGRWTAAAVRARQCAREQPEKEGNCLAAFFQLSVAFFPWLHLPSFSFPSNCPTAQLLEGNCSCRCLLSVGQLDGSCCQGAARLAIAALAVVTAAGSVPSVGLAFPTLIGSVLPGRR